MIPDLPTRLTKRLKEPLPGPMEGTRFAALNRPGPSVAEIPPEAKPAAVLALLYPVEHRWYLPVHLAPSTPARPRWTGLLSRRRRRAGRIP